MRGRVCVCPMDAERGPSRTARLPRTPSALHPFEEQKARTQSMKLTMHDNPTALSRVVSRDLLPGYHNFRHLRKRRGPITRASRGESEEGREMVVVVGQEGEGRVT